MAVPRLFRSQLFRVFLALLILGAVLWLAFPTLLTAYVNYRLARLENYQGETKRVSVNLWRGTYRLEDLTLIHRQAPDRVPVLEVPELDLLVAWGPLIRGKFVAEIDAHRPVFNHLVAPEIPPDPDPPALHESLSDVLPFRIDRLTIHDGEFHYRNFKKKPELDIYVQKLKAVVRNFTNDSELSETLVAHFEGGGSFLGSAGLDFEGNANFMAREPTFDLDLDLQRLLLERISDFLEGETGLATEAGTMSMSADLRGKDGRITGRANAILKNLRFAAPRQEDDGVIGKLWGAARRAFDPVLTTPPDTLSLRVPIDVRVDRPGEDFLASVGEAFRDAFIDAYRKRLMDFLPTQGG